MVEHTFNPSTRERLGQAELSELLANLVYIASSRAARTIQ